ALGDDQIGQWFSDRLFAAMGKRGQAHFLLCLRPMPRRTRIHIDGLPLHIVQRGHNRAACFFDDQDRRAYLGWLHEALVRERCRMHAYVLMTNHVHLLLTPHPLYLGLGDDEEARRAAYRELFGGALDDQLLGALRLALNQDQPVGNDRFYREIEAMTGQRRELRKRGRPRKQDEPLSADVAGQGELPL
ncbi:transposase, partial [Thiocapsa sp.]|uniref:transposase n=1 Tax=Thiocapsa sp. TaxID=2024551 RepID=UPI0025FED121